MMITDTRKVWAEAMTSAQFARRWRTTNPKAQSYALLDEQEEDKWREARLDLLGKAHSVGAFADLAFEVVSTRYSDFAVRIEAESFTWVWETTFVGYRLSAELLSQQLIMPMISLSHFALGSQEVIAEMTDDDLQKAVDKVGRTARRTPDTHVRNAIAKPRAATCLRRMSAILNFLPEPLQKPDLSAPEELPQDIRREVPSRRAPPSSAKKSSRPPSVRSPTPQAQSPPPPSRGSPIEVDSDSPAPAPRRTSTPPPAAKTSDAPADESVTESSTDDEDAPPPKKVVAPSNKGKAAASKPASRRISPLLSSSPSPPPSMKAKLGAEGSLKPTSSAKPSSSVNASTTSRPASSAARAGSSKPQAQGSMPAPKARVVDSSDSDSPAPPPKRTRTESSSDDDQPTRRGTRQPLRRGRKRF
ncbi:uncharacterized protein SCHCODRAFT_02519350 [Schizophyllum commune H4-8]|nr:uncharacterized protein SCHCODRAFT_02519350 [Schizophyllum commune H4-8]KAI5886120.1 hypothetical protein SCHCODRAFT_02519350 [Schizophyllum commune H4-8]